ncbi:histone H1-like [Pantherophis guttatus]|uniref:Histone H1-like n=1 Tax=Pantherophis guttatus TaxID=94885 RepID=A0A6P9BJB3_PANGU|nr:histone H1-like [Pantherophis guttatus]
MMESSAFPEAPTLDTSNDVAESPQTEDADEGPDSENIPGSSEAAAAQDPLLHGGRNHSRKRATLPSERSGKRLNKTRAAAPKPPTSTLSLLIYSAVASSKKKSGLSMQALKKIVADMGYDMVKKKHYFLRSIKNMVAKGQLWQIKGTGATGSFKISPDIGKKKPPIVKGKGPKAKYSTKNKKRSAVSKNARETAKKQVKANVKKACKRGKMSSVQDASVQVKV